MTLADLLRPQADLTSWITNFWVNIYKKGQANVTHGTLTHRQDVLEKYWERFVEQHQKIMVEPGASESDYVTKKVFQMVEDSYFECAGKIRDAIRAFDPPTTSTGNKPQGTISGQMGTSKLASLAKIQLPVFDGDWLNWPSFKGLFESLVHNDAEVPKNFKLQQLLAHVSGEAAQMLENIDISDEGYDGAWKELVDCYENDYLLLFKYIRYLVDCAPAARSSAAELKRITSTFKRSKRAFLALKRPVDQWSDWLLFLCIEKLDNTTKMHWQTSLKNNKEIPSFDQLLDFLQCRIQALTVTYSGNTKQNTSSNTSSAVRQSNRGSKPTVTLHTATKGSEQKKRSCPLCQKGHSLGYCPQLKSLKPSDRWTKAKSLKVCLNCFSTKHITKNCLSQTTCQVDDCNQKHHFLLHQNQGTQSSNTRPSDFSTPASQNSDAKTERSAISSFNTVISKRSVFLGTAWVTVENFHGEKMTIRALLDHAAESSFISERVAQLLRVKRTKVSVPTAGLQGTPTGEVKATTQMRLRSPQLDTFSLPCTFLIIPTVSGRLPSDRIPLRRWPHFDGLNLADPEFSAPGRVDAILGADVYGALLTGEIRFNSLHEPTALSTVFGWIIVGPTGAQSTYHQPVPIFHCTTSTLSNQLQKFWELEEVSNRDAPPPSADHCERQFRESHYREKDGRYVVRLPVTSDESVVLGDSRRAAMQLFLTTERKLLKNVQLREKYSAFMGEYEELGHMAQIDTLSDKTKFYLPHHAVFRHHDQAGKIRVVFNASFKSSSSFSLNDKLLPGPKLQSELWVVLSRWRMFKYAFTADIVKMFRQIKVNRDDRDLQRILWRKSPDSEIYEYQLTTVTYGTAPAPFLALRVLLQLASDEEQHFPLGAQTIRQNSYVDDIFSGADTLSQALEVKNQVEKILAAG